MKLIRKGVFETNSSSSHSLSISDEDVKFETIYPDLEGRIILEGGEFGWGYDLFKDAYTKANYVATAVKILEEMKISFDKEGKTDNYYSLSEFASENYYAAKAIFEKVIKDQTGCKEIIYDFNTNYDYNSDKPHAYIDHQSFEDPSDGLFLLDEKEIRNFIFNPKSELIIDNDNH